MPLCVPCVMHIAALLWYGCQSVLLHHTGMQAARAKRRHKGGQLQKGPVNVPPGATEVNFHGSSTRCSYIERSNQEASSSPSVSQLLLAPSLLVVYILTLGRLAAGRSQHMRT